jgi:hypothetical protein
MQYTHQDFRNGGRLELKRVLFQHPGSALERWASAPVPSVSGSEGLLGRAKE